MSNIIIMAISPRNIIGCLLKIGLQRGGGGGGHGHPRTHPPRYALEKLAIEKTCGGGWSVLRDEPKPRLQKRLISQC